MIQENDKKPNRISSLIKKRDSLAEKRGQSQFGNSGRDKDSQLLQSPKLRKKLIDYLSGQNSTEKGKGSLFTSSSIKQLGLDKLESFDDFSTSSTTEEILRYKKKLENRATWLDSIFEETLRELEKIAEFLDKKSSSTKKQAAKTRDAKS